MSKISHELADKVDLLRRGRRLHGPRCTWPKKSQLGILDRLRVAFSAMACANWTNIEEVVVENQYVNMFQSILARDIPT